jgi:hypothetical protein
VSKRSGEECPAEQLFGITFESLTDEQLEKINTHKLVEFLGKDVNKVSRIIGDRFAKCDLIELRELTQKCLQEVPYIYEKYNEMFIARRSEILRHDARREFFHWEALNKANKMLEFERYLDEEDSLISVHVSSRRYY